MVGNEVGAWMVGKYVCPYLVGFLVGNCVGEELGFDVVVKPSPVGE